MKRPAHLPEFNKPPLEELLLGVQFAQVPGLSSVNMGDIWGLFKKDFPKVQEQPVLHPQFEMFGGLNAQPGMQFQVFGGQGGSRLWFLTEQENHLLQFQVDRFLTNWRKSPNPQQSYPRFDVIAEAYESGLSTLAAHLKEHFSYAIDINQGEVAYVNIVPVEDFSEAGKWFKFWNDTVAGIENVTVSFNDVFRDASGKPFARLFHAIQAVHSVDGKQKAFNFTLTFRGKPERNDIPSAMEFLAMGRDAIAMRFKAITTSYAHDSWEIIK